MAEVVGRQSVVVIIDVKGGREVYTHNGTRRSGIDAVELARRAAELGAGEIVVNSIDNDGIMKGYDIELIERMRKAISIPLDSARRRWITQGYRHPYRPRFGIIGAAAAVCLCSRASTCGADELPQPHRQGCAHRAGRESLNAAHAHRGQHQRISHREIVWRS